MKCQTIKNRLNSLMTTCMNPNGKAEKIEPNLFKNNDISFKVHFFAIYFLYFEVFQLQFNNELCALL